MQNENIKKILDTWTDSLVQCAERLVNDSLETMQSRIRDQRAQLEEVLKAETSITGDKLLALLEDPKHIVVVKVLDAKDFGMTELDNWKLGEHLRDTVSGTPSSGRKKCRIMLIVENLDGDKTEEEG
jgi:hypothetical protein